MQQLRGGTIIFTMIGNLIFIFKNSYSLNKIALDHRFIKFRFAFGSPKLKI